MSETQWWEPVLADAAWTAEWATFVREWMRRTPRSVILQPEDAKLIAAVDTLIDLDAGEGKP